VLDVGCATGAFLDLLRTHGWTGIGLDLDASAIQYARDTLGLDVRQQSIREANLPENSVDVATLWDVIEHLHDPLDVLKELRRVTRPGGKLIVRTPDIASLDARVFGEYWIGLDVPRHLYLFDDRTLARAVETAGYVVEAIEHGSGHHRHACLSAELWIEARTESHYGRMVGRMLINLLLWRALLYPIHQLRSLIGQGPSSTLVARVVK
jgi:2-polyprenyl-3-methyl-5-hydroxy-6-metoxy-1,4-benzoquinol methylase